MKKAIVFLANGFEEMEALGTVDILRRGGIEVTTVSITADLVVTGEGRIDWQSAFGKVPSGIGMRCKAKGVPAVAIVGGMGTGAEKIYEFGVESIVPTINGAMDLEEALERAEELYANAADRTFRMIRVGMQMK